MKDCFRGPFSSYETWKKTLASKKPNFNEKAFKWAFPEEKYSRIRQALDCYDFTYEVDGLTIEGYYLAPKERQTKLPVVIYNRGGNAEFGYVMFAKKLLLQADLAQAGYVVIGSQYRGASARFIKNNGADEFGGADVDDVTALVDVLPDIPMADSSRIALVGWSRGAMQSYLAAKGLSGVKAIVSIAGVADLEKELSWRPKMENVYRGRIPDYDNNKSAALAARSVINWLDELPDAPVLLLHGSEDKRVNPEQSHLLAAALDKVEHKNKLVIYEGDNHGLVNNRQAMQQEVIAWLDEYMK
ncbi:MAG: S9 family peptidase [Alteromonadaceae bacterium]|nr:S9 family peptidase [Alteromonadaceae bacterium]